MTVTEYFMEPKSGNILVEGIVQTALKNKFSYDWVGGRLNVLSDTKGFEEAMDTMVREAVLYELDKQGVN